MIAGLTIYKYVATGNDFIILDNWDGKISLEQKDVVDLCDRRFGVGADGVLVLSQGDEADFRMTYFNADASRGEMCGNGARALIKFARDNKRIGDSGKFVADDGIHKYSINSDQILVEIKVADDLHPWSTPHAGCGFINTGVPHLIIPVDDTHAQDLMALGSQMNGHEKHPQGINTNIVARLGSILEVRTWERGVNAETLACGTGATAVAIFAHSDWKKEWPIQLQFKGGLLEVDFRDNRYWLTGSTSLVFDGHIA